MMLFHIMMKICVDESFFYGCFGCEGETGNLLLYTENSISFRIEI